MQAATIAFALFEQQLPEVLFLSVRAGAAMLAAPLFGAMSVPVQLRAFFGVVLAVFIHQWMPLPPLPDLLSMAGMVALLQEVVAGFALGFVLQIAFAIPLIAAEQIAGTMGMAMATSVDPASGSQSGAIGQMFSLTLIFVFLGLGAHLLWFELLLESYHAVPPGPLALSAEAMKRIVMFGGQMLVTAAAIALPVVLVLLLVQIATGVLSRSAPSLNLFALGLPAGVLAGIAALIAVLPVVFEQFADVSRIAVEQAAGVLLP
ncbi:MAG: flagellar biosynthetic protein FliR [Erythrobacter sp. 34-65-8]|nr:MAG: flagellar biosynthetic protein FliR [Erythrobacter sp. 34-65-8]